MHSNAMLQRLLATETSPVLPGAALLSGASTVYPGYVYTPKGALARRLAMLAAMCMYGHMF